MDELDIADPAVVEGEIRSLLLNLSIADRRRIVESLAHIDQPRSGVVSIEVVR